MGSTDSLPVVSQAKSVVQLVTGDVDGAARTQENFFRECPGVSQVTSVVQLATGDVEGAAETQIRCGKGLMRAADGVPVVGHVKGLVHYAVGDTEGGHTAMKAATRTTGVLAGGAVGFVTLGPVGAVVGGIEGGALLDVGTTVVTGKPSGYVAAIDNAVKNPNAGDIFDLTMMPVFDGIAGYGAGKMVQKANQASSVAKAEALEVKAAQILENAEAKAQTGQINSGQYMAESNQAMNLHQQAQALKGDVSAPVGPKGTATQGAPKPVVPAPGVEAATPIYTPAEPSTSQEAESKTQTESKTDSAMVITNIENLVMDTMDLLQVKGSMQKIKAVTSLLVTILTDDSQVFLQSLKTNLESLKIEFFCKINDQHILAIILCTSKYSSSGSIPLAVKMGKKIFEKIRNKAKLVTESEAMVLLKILLDRQNKDDKIEKQPSKKGEHVINNGVLKAYGKMIDRYLSARGLKPVQELYSPLGDFMKDDLSTNDGVVRRSYLAPLNAPHDENIRSKMVVKVEGIYVDLNAIMFGWAIKFLVDRVVKLMMTAPEWQDVRKQEIRFVVGLMNKSRVYVDQEAKRLWLKGGDSHRQMYVAARDEVAEMFDFLGTKTANLPLRWRDELESWL